MKLKKPFYYFITIVFFIFSHSITANSNIEQAKQSIEWIKSYNCPMPGKSLEVEGLETPQKTIEMASSNWALSKTTLSSITHSISKKNQFINSIRKKRSLNSEDNQVIYDLDQAVNNATAKVATGLVYWSLAKFVEISRSPISYPPNSRVKHPLEEFVRDGLNLSQLIKELGRTTTSIEFLTPINKKYSQCLYIAQYYVMRENASNILDASDNAKSSSDIDQIKAKYILIRKPKGLDNLPEIAVLAKLEAKKNHLKQLEQLAADEREKFLAKQRADARVEAERLDSIKREEQRKYLQKKISLAKKQIPTAISFINSLNSRSLNQTSRLMSQGITLSIPRLGTKRGKSTVLDLMTKASSGHLSSPKVNQNGYIISNGSGSGGKRFQLYITVSSSLITQLRIVKI